MNNEKYVVWNLKQVLCQQTANMLWFFVVLLGFLEYIRTGVAVIGRCIINCRVSLSSISNQRLCMYVCMFLPMQLLLLQLIIELEHDFPHHAPKINFHSRHLGTKFYQSFWYERVLNRLLVLWIMIGFVSNYKFNLFSR